MSECIIFTGAIDTTGYGRMWWEGRALGAHRVAWMEANGPIPDGMQVCHTCDVRACINVEHLFLGTPAENMADMIQKGRAHHPGLTRDRHGATKIREHQLPEVFAMRQGGATQTAIAERFNVSQGTISSILRKITPPKEKKS